MASLLSALTDAPRTTWVFTAAAMALIWTYKKFFSDTPLSKDGKPMPPMISCGFLETIKALTGSRAPSFMLENCRGADNDIYQYRITPYGVGLPHLVTIGDAELAMAVLRDPKSLKPVIKNKVGKDQGAGNLLFSDGHRWRHARRAVAPAFASKHVSRMNVIVVKQVKTWINETLIPKLVDKDESFDVAQTFLHQILKGIAVAGMEYNMSDEETEVFITEANIAMTELQAQMINPVRRILSSFTPSGRRASLAKERMDQFVQNVLDNYRSLENPQDDTVISAIVNNDAYLSDGERLADIRIFFVAGFETTAYSLSWTLLELAKNPAEQTKVRNALLSVPVNERRNVPELRNAIKEGMRLHPVSAGGIRRVLMKDFTTDKYFHQKERLLLLELLPSIVIKSILTSQMSSGLRDG